MLQQLLASMYELRPDAFESDQCLVVYLPIDQKWYKNSETARLGWLWLYTHPWGSLCSQLSLTHLFSLITEQWMEFIFNRNIIKYM